MIFLLTLHWLSFKFPEKKIEFESIINKYSFFSSWFACFGWFWGEGLRRKEGGRRRGDVGGEWLSLCDTPLFVCTVTEKIQKFLEKNSKSLDCWQILTYIYMYIYTICVYILYYILCIYNVYIILINVYWHIYVYNNTYISCSLALRQHNKHRCHFHLRCKNRVPFGSSSSNFLF